METVEWLSSYATEAQQGLIKPLATERGGKGIYKAIKQAVVFTLTPNIKALFFIGNVFMTSTDCNSESSESLPDHSAQLVLILVGGNSESIHRGGIWELYSGKSNPKSDMTIVSDLANKLAISPDQIDVHYYSWTGDSEDHKCFLPGHWNWITGGSSLIQEQLPVLKSHPESRPRIAIVGWSNGGATAYELSCDLSKLFPEAVSLLVTMDPVSWTTNRYSDASNSPSRVAQNWINVYTRSNFRDRLFFGNIVALIGRAWNDSLPSTGADDLIFLEGANHGDTKRMWKEKVLDSEVLNRWALH